MKCINHNKIEAKYIYHNKSVCEECYKQQLINDKKEGIIRLIGIIIWAIVYSIVIYGLLTVKWH